MEEDRQARELSPTDSVGAEEIRAIVNRWATNGFFRAKGWGDRIAVISTRRIPYYALVLETQYEHRAIETRSRPYDDGPVDTVGIPPDLWDVEVPSPVAFGAKRVESTPVPHTRVAVRCAGCSGLGRVDCSACRGSGKMDRGAGARRGCPACGGQGWISHPACSGKGKLLQFSVVISEFTCKTVDEKLCSADLPRRLAKEAESEILVDHRREGGGFVSRDLYPEMSPSFQGLWRQSVPRDQSTTRILFQRYRIEGLKGFEVVYETPASRAPRKLWIVGDKLYASPFPVAWKRVVGAAVPAVAGVYAAILLSMILLSSGSNPFRTGQDPTVPSPEASSAAAARSASRGGPGQGAGKARPPGAGEGHRNALAGEGRSSDRAHPDAGGAQRNADSSGAVQETASPAPDLPASGDAGQGAGDNGSGADASIPDPFSLEQSPSGTFDVLAGTFTDETQAQSVATQIEEAAYQPTVTPTVDPNDLPVSPATTDAGSAETSVADPSNLHYVVSVRGFVSQAAAEEAVQTLKDLGIVAQVDPNAPTASSASNASSAP